MFGHAPLLIVITMVELALGPGASNRIHIHEAPPLVTSGGAFLLFVRYRPFLARKPIRSTTRQEYPHSLSYQATTLARFPSSTFVNWPSTMELLEFFIISLETTGSIVKLRMPFNSPSAALLRAALTSSPVVFFFRMATKSTTETFGVG